MGRRDSRGAAWVCIALAAAAGTALGQPANNPCASAEVVALTAGEKVQVVGTTVGATADSTGGLTCGSSGTSPDVWYRVVAPANGMLVASTCEGTAFNTVVGIKTTCAATTGLNCNDNNCGSQSKAMAVVTGGQTYHVRVAGASGASGPFMLTIEHRVGPAATLGPDVWTSVLPSMQRYGTSADGTITAYSVGTTSCNAGDYPVRWIDNSNFLPDFDNTKHPVIAQNMYRLKTYTAPGGAAYQRFEQLGQSWLKHGFVSTNSSGCGTCEPSLLWRNSLQSFQNVGGDAIGVNCSDTYGSSLNGSHSYLGARSIVNSTLGTSPFIRGNGTGEDVIKMRLQVPTVDITAQPAGTRFFAEGYYCTQDDAQFVRPGETVAVNGLNNASHREVSVASLGLSTQSFVGNTVQMLPAIHAWKAADPAVTLVTADHDDTENPGTGFPDMNGNPSFPGTFIRSRFWVAGKATDLGGGLYRYEYAVYNHNSDRGAGSFTLAVPAGAVVTDPFFRAPRSHSGEPYSNDAWAMVRSGTELAFRTQTHAENPNANAVRWATMYNFGFTANVAPVTGGAVLGLFKPGSIPAIEAAGLPVPTPPPACGTADFDGDGNTATDADIEAFFACLSGSCCATCFEGGADFNMDGDTATDADIEAFFRVLAGGSC